LITTCVIVNLASLNADRALKVNVPINTSPENVAPSTAPPEVTMFWVCCVRDRRPCMPGVKLTN